VNSKASASGAEAIALARFGLSSRVQELLRQPVPLTVALDTVASSSVLEREGSNQPVARRTLEDWWYAYPRGGFAALHPKARSDRGVPRVLTPEQERHILEQVKAHPAIAVKVLYRQWKEQDPKLPAISAVYRALQRPSLDQRARRYLVRQALSGPTKAFEAPWVNELWLVDFSPGPFLHVPDQKKALATHVCAILDDHSRLVAHAAYYLNADTRSFHQSFKQAIQRRGLPRKLYTDQGRPFTHDHTRVLCANLGLRLLHAKPDHAWSKGKLESSTKWTWPCADWKCVCAWIRGPWRGSRWMIVARALGWPGGWIVNSTANSLAAPSTMKSDADLQHLARQWGAHAVPFAQLGPKDWLETPAVQKALGYLTQTAALRSVLLLCGPNGVGTSALVGRWMRSLDERLFHPVCLTQATLSGSGILGSLTAKLGKAWSFRRERNLQRIEEALAELERRILVLVLDEAQNYAPSALEEVRLLLGLNLPEAPAFALILIGDEYLLSRLKLRNHRALYSRLACQVSLPVWNGAQCAQSLSNA
jgi:type II secretory pathway predicted ATPase ExeA/transposase InsO family protein